MSYHLMEARQHVCTAGDLQRSKADMSIYETLGYEGVV